ncbi:MAG: hypothetical protein JXP34_01745 [Planctomycetes bacterium]|nr:hypothetical protein [Planctomycetota bacterium]
MGKRWSAIAFAAAGLVCAGAWGAPKYRLDEASGVRDQVVEIPLQLTYEEAIRGFSFAIRFEASALEFVEADLGTATAPIGEMFLVASGSGETPEDAVVGGCVFDALEPHQGQVLPPGIDQQIAIVRVRIRAAAPIAVSPVDLEEQPGPHGLLIQNLVSTLAGEDALTEITSGGVRVLPRPASSLVCERQPEDRSTVVLQWTNAEADLEAVRIYRNAVLIETLPGSAETYADADAGSGAVDYAVEPVAATGAGARRACSVGPLSVFVRGDVNGDNQIDIGDPIEALNFLYAEKPIDCWDAVDINDNGVLDLADPIRLLMYEFSEGEPPAQPFPDPGPDPTPDDPYGCDRV